jgi:hypothetical protein
MGGLLLLVTRQSYSKWRAGMRYAEEGGLVPGRFRDGKGDFAAGKLEGISAQVRFSLTGDLQGLNRLRNKGDVMGNFQKIIPQGLKPESFYWRYRHD